MYYNVNQILPNLYLGAYSLYFTDFVDIKNIKYAIDLSNENNVFIDKIDYHMKYNHIFDHPKQDLLAIIPDCVDFINQATRQNQNILINCFAGVSRSSSIVLAYLMYLDVVVYKRPANLNNSLNWLKSRRSIVNPNYGFLDQLITYQNYLNKHFR
jgi:protein-tyrosine phosphatase